MSDEAGATSGRSIISELGLYIATRKVVKLLRTKINPDAIILAAAAPHESVRNVHINVFAEKLLRFTGSEDTECDTLLTTTER